MQKWYNDNVKCKRRCCMSNLEKIADIKISEIDAKDVIRGFIATASMGFCHKEEVVEKCQLVEEKIDDLNSSLGELEAVAQRWEGLCDSTDSKVAYELADSYGTEEDIQTRYKSPGSMPQRQTMPLPSVSVTVTSSWSEIDCMTIKIYYS